MLGIMGIIDFDRVERRIADLITAFGGKKWPPGIETK
jgi:hypothetical protein